MAAYIEQLQGRLSAPSVKQHLAALRVLFDWLVVGQVIPFNPASSVRGPRHSVREGKTPVLIAEEARAMLDAIDISTAVGLRDRALIWLMVYTFARVGVVADACTDATAILAAKAGVLTLPVKARNVGAVRAAGPELMLAHERPESGSCAGRLRRRAATGGGQRLQGLASAAA